jgi:hypothetical protein
MSSRATRRRIISAVSPSRAAAPPLPPPPPSSSSAAEGRRRAPPPREGAPPSRLVRYARAQGVFALLRAPTTSARPGFVLDELKVFVRAGGIRFKSARGFGVIAPRIALLEDEIGKPIHERTDGTRDKAGAPAQGDLCA